MTSPRKIRLISPSGYCHDRAAAERGIARLQSEGHHLENLSTLQRRFQRFAGTDKQRSDEFNQLTQPGPLPDIVMAVRGGYGASRLLDHLDYVGLQRRLLNQPLALCGHSDFTAIQLALLAQTGMITFSAPMLAGNFGAPVLSEFTLSHFWQALTSPEFRIHWPASISDNGQWQGTLWGGNLAMLVSLIGTPWMPQIKGGILVIEDVNEHPFRVERMLLQLHHCGILARQQAIVTGSFTGASLSRYDAGYDLPAVWQHMREITGLPIVTDLAFGHDSDTVTLPLGARALLSVNQGSAELQLGGHPTLR